MPAYDLYWVEVPPPVQAIGNRLRVCKQTGAIIERADLDALAAARRETGSHLALDADGAARALTELGQLGALDYEAQPVGLPQLADYAVPACPDCGGHPDLEHAHYRRYEDEVRRVTRHNTGGRIPAYKFCSNDGWRIYPAELRASLALLPAGFRPSCAELGQLLAFFRLAAEHGGLEVW